MLTTPETAASPEPSRESRFSALVLAQRLIRQTWFVRAINPLIGRFNPFLPEFRENPYPTYHRLRSQTPMYRSRLVGGWILSRHRDITAVLQDPRFSVERQRSKMFQRIQPFRGMQPAFVEAITRNLLMLDAPDHTRLRRLVSRAFTPRMVAGLRPRIDALVDELLDAVAAQPVVDFVAEVAYPLPVIVICELLGVPPADREQLKHWSDQLATLLDPLQGEGGVGRLERTYDEVATYFRRIFAERRAVPRDDLISGLVAVEDAGDTLSEAELLSLTVLLLAAGHETTTNLLGNAVAALLRFPGERRRLTDDPGLIGSAVEEFLRYDSPVQLTDRVALEDLELCGRRVQAGQMVGLLLAAANRDPEVFPDPDRLDLGRADNPHLAFSHGAHFCLGAALARIEAQVTIAAWLRRYPDFTAAPGALEHRRSIVLRGLTALPLQLRSGT
jgi:cytochrome P450